MSSLLVQAAVAASLYADALGQTGVPNTLPADEGDQRCGVPGATAGALRRLDEVAQGIIERSSALQASRGYHEPIERPRGVSQGGPAVNTLPTRLWHITGQRCRPDGTTELVHASWWGVSARAAILQWCSIQMPQGGRPAWRPEELTAGPASEDPAAMEAQS